jgi:hypothetical protein
MTAWIDTFDNASSLIKGYLVIQGRAAATASVINIFSVTGITSATGYYKISVNYISGTLPGNGNGLAINFSPTGDSGPTGPTGPTGSDATALPGIFLLGGM